MMKIYHNPRCTKSREALVYLEEKGLETEVIKYMDEPLTPDELRDLLDMLDMEAIELVRTNEDIWKEQFRDKELDEDELILAMIEYPELMQRPIVVNGNQAVVGRPAGAIDQLE